MHRYLGFAAAGAWFVLSGITLAGLATGRPSLTLVNLVMAVAFAMIALFQIWRSATIDHLRRELPDNPRLATLLRIETIAALCMLALGGLFAFAAGIRVFGEGVAVFG